MEKQQWPMMLGKDIDTVADMLETKFVKDAKRTERVEHPVEDMDQRVIDITGNFEVLDLEEMDMWGGNLRFELRDVSAQDEEQAAARGQIAMHAPELAVLMTSPTQMRVYRETLVKTTTKTTVEKWSNGRRISYRAGEPETVEATEWEEITADFARKGMRQFGWK